MSFSDFIKDIPEPPKPDRQALPRQDWSVEKSMDLAREIIAAGGIAVQRETDKGGDHYFNLLHCVFDSTHTDNDAAIIVRANGTICYHCFHDSCSDRTWSDVRELYMPKKQEEYQYKPKPRKKVTVKPGSIYNGVCKLFKDGLASGESTGWSNLDNFYTVLPGQWTLVTGIPSHGKSSFIDALMVNLHELHGWKFAVFSPENHPVELHASKLVEIFVGKSFTGTYRWPRMTEKEMELGAKKINDVFNFIQHGDNVLTIDGILGIAQQIVDDKGVNGLVIDPWNEIDHVIGSDTETLYISKALTKIRLFARNNNVHIWVVAHPTKMMKNLSGGYDVPTPYDVAGGAHWRNKADNALTVHRPTFEPGDFRVDVHIQKVRFKHIGKPGQVSMQYQLDCGRYVEAE